MNDNDTQPWNPELKRPCLSQEHNPPSHLYIEPGRRFEHTCPSCGKKTILLGPEIYW